MKDKTKREDLLSEDMLSVALSTKLVGYKALAVDVAQFVQERVTQLEEQYQDSLRSSESRNGWPADPAARKREMKRRMAKRQQTAAARATHPRDKNHPDHENWLKKVTAVQRKRWARMTRAERQARLAKMSAGKKKPKKQIKVAGRKEAELPKLAVAS
jgi:hypothetical protein